MKKKVAFIYFDDLHHIHHFIGVAEELAKNDNIRVDIITYSNFSISVEDGKLLWISIGIISVSYTHLRAHET